MTRAEVNALCAAHPGAGVSEPFGEGHEVWKVCGKIFAIVGTSTGAVSVKTDGIETAELLIEAGVATRAPYLHRSWVALPLHADPDELRNVAQEPRYADVVAAMRAEIEARYDLEALEVEVLASQRRRSVVAHALLQGRTRPWDLTVTEQERYVRGDFWAAFRYAKLADGQG